MTDNELPANWPLVDEKDDGIRPAGRPDECFYCRQKVGQPHGKGCVIVERKVKLRYTFDIEVYVPYTWDAAFIHFHRNEGTWCADNALDELAAYGEKQGCLCRAFEATYMGDVDNTPHRDLMTETEQDEGEQND